jgi:hypothetical protein
MGLSGQDRKYAEIATRAGAQYAYRIVAEARRSGIMLSWAFALFEQESDFRNIFGCDWGMNVGSRYEPPYCRVPVTKERVAALLAYGKPNGVGPGQLTDFSYVRRAERTKVSRAYGAHLPGNNIRVSLEVLAEKTGGDMKQAWRYNGARSYQDEIKAKQIRWHNTLT